MPMQRLVRLLLMVAVLIVSVRAESDEVGDVRELAPELIESLSGFAKAHDLSDSQMRDLLGEIVFNDRKLKKGGVGVIGNDVFVIVDGTRNEIVFGNERWEGGPVTVPETVLTDGHQVLCSVRDIDPGETRFIFFSPTEVRYIDQMTRSGGVYLRRSAQSP